MKRAPVLLCTVGTSLPGNLGALGGSEPAFPEASRAWAAGDWNAVAQILGGFEPSERALGAEINSVADMAAKGYCAPDAALLLFHSATAEGRNTARVLELYFQGRGHPVERREIEHLQDENPKLFKSKGLRNLAKAVCRAVRERGPDNCAVNATGGYKAQIAIAVLLGQALGVPVYYKHERFSEVIAFPAMPVSLDHALWLRHSGLLAALDRNALVSWPEVEDDWEAGLEPLVDRVPIGETQYLELSPVGQIFHESFKGRFRDDRNQMLPPSVPAGQKAQPRLTDHGWGSAREPILKHLKRVVSECPYVRVCRDTYWNPDLAATPLFRLKGDTVEGVWSNGTWTAKFVVETSAFTSGQREACVADLNERLERWG